MEPQFISADPLLAFGKAGQDQHATVLATTFRMTQLLAYVTKHVWVTRIYDLGLSSGKGGSLFAQRDQATQPLENLADLLSAALACSRPVSDEGWRSHDEHTGQTGKIIAPNLYMAFGISGAIQHLAGVSSSKCIVAVNTDKDAPIFEAADYGIVGDALKILPGFIDEIKAAKAQ